MSKSIFVSILLIVLFSVNVAYGENCLNYGLGEVTLEGTLTLKVLPGPPEYESVEKGDRPERYWLLNLSKSVCVNEEPDDITFDDGKDIRRMHLVINPKEYTKYERLVSKKVIVIGILSRKYSGYDHTRVLEVISIRPANARSRK